MKILYFLGGEDIKKRDSSGINRKAFTDAGGAPAILIFPWTAKTADKTDKHRQIMDGYFKDLGAEKVELAELSDSFEVLAERIESSNLIYLPGGSSILLVKRLKRVNMLLTKYNGVIIGNSAGALSLCRRYVHVEKDNTKTEITMLSGLGLVDFAVAVHYNSQNPRFSGRGENEIRQLSEKAGVKIYAIPERCALAYDGKNLKSIGDIYLFYKGRKMKCR